jgi:hypothetical protein
MKIAYITQRACTTACTTGPARAAIATTAASTIVPSSAIGAIPNRRRVRSLIASMNAWYTPTARSMVPPEMPGTRFARPMRAPPNAARTRAPGRTPDAGSGWGAGSGIGSARAKGRMWRAGPRGARGPGRPVGRRRHERHGHGRGGVHRLARRQEAARRGPQRPRGGQLLGGPARRRPRPQGPAPRERAIHLRGGADRQPRRDRGPPHGERDRLGHALRGLRRRPRVDAQAP